MNRQERAILDRLVRDVKELLRDKHQNERGWEINRLNFTICDPDWWDGLTPDQFVDASNALRDANRFWLERHGLAVQFVTYTTERDS